VVGKTLAHYEIRSPLGQGGMGEVFVAHDRKLSRDVAFKVLPSELAANPERLARFEREAKAIAALNHPNIVHVYSVEAVDGIHFITMELVKGKTLAEAIPRGGFEVGRFFAIAIELSEAVAAAHRQGVIHRDLKPSNVMLSDEGRVKVLDFGLAKPRELASDSLGSELDTSLKTAEGRVLGTMSYMAPDRRKARASTSGRTSSLSASSSTRCSRANAHSEATRRRRSWPPCSRTRPELRPSSGRTCRRAFPGS
jgi:serine/threonine protein kinase